MNHDEVRELAELYVVGAVEPEVAEAIEEHLSACADCRRWVDDLSPSVEALGLAVPSVAPPENLRQRLVDAAGSDSADPAPPPVRLLRLPDAPVEVRPRHIGPHWTREWPRLALAAATLLFILSGWLGIRNAELQREVQTARAEMERMREYEQALTIVQLALQEGGSMVRVDGTENAPGAKGMVYAPRQGHRGVLAVSGLPAHPGEGYQLWLIRGETRMNGGYFEPEASGKCLMMVEAPMPLDQFDAFGVTSEQRGGSPAPQGKRFMWGRSPGT